MKLLCIVLILFSVSFVSAGEKRLTREQFNLVAESADELDEIVARIEAIRDRLRSVEKEKDAPVRVLPPAPAEPIIPIPLNELDLPAPKTEKPIEIVETKQEKPVVKVRSLLLITSPAWCEACRWVNKISVPKLKKSGWIVKDFGSGGVAHLWVINRDAQGDAAAKFDGEMDVIPLWVLLVDDVVVSRKEGAMTAEEVVKFKEQDVNH